MKHNIPGQHRAYSGLRSTSFSAHGLSHCYLLPYPMLWEATQTIKEGYIYIFIKKKVAKEIKLLSREGSNSEDENLASK